MTFQSSSRTRAGYAIRRVYLLQDAETKELVGPNGIVDAPKQAKRWSSRLAARQASIALFGKQATNWIVVPHDISVPVPLPVPKLAVDDPIEIAHRLWDLHSDACARCDDWMVRVGVDPPTHPSAVLTSRPTKWIGLYSSSDHTCSYSLPYAGLRLGMGGPHDFAEIVLHEVAHAYQRALVGPGVLVGHGGDWFAIMRRALHVPEPLIKVPGEPEEIMLGAMRYLRRKVERAVEAGAFAGLGVSVVTQSIKRRGVC